MYGAPLILKFMFISKILQIHIVYNVALPQVFFFFNTIFVSSHMYSDNPEGTQVIVGSMNMGCISDTARNRTHNLFRPKREPMPLGHSPVIMLGCKFSTGSLVYTCVP